MPQPPDKPSNADESPASGDVPANSPPREKTSGRVAFDSRGNAVWEWRTGDRQFSRDASTTLVERLEAPDLSLQTTRIAKGAKPPAAARSGEALPRNAAESDTCNPYNHPVADIGRRASQREPGDHPTTRPAPKLQAAKAPAKPQGLMERMQRLIGRKGH
jgi:hypothetical protein